MPSQRFDSSLNNTTLRVLVQRYHPLRRLEQWPSKKLSTTHTHSDIHNQSFYSPQKTFDIEKPDHIERNPRLGKISKVVWLYRPRHFCSSLALAGLRVSWHHSGPNSCALTQIHLKISLPPSSELASSTLSQFCWLGGRSANSASRRQAGSGYTMGFQ